ncbi:MAG: SDR family oxidoreductase [Nostocoides sp.]
MSRVVLFGGHGKVALLLEPLLVAAGYAVSAVIRNPGHTDEVAATGVTPVVADIEQLDVNGMTGLLDGHDVVIWSAGAGGGNPLRTYALDRDAAIRSMDAAAATGIRRYVMVSYFGAGPEHGVPEGDSFFPYAEAKSAADAHLRARGLDWTIVAPSRLTLEAGTGRIDLAATTASSVSRADVASVVAACVDRDGTIGQTLRFNAGNTPIGQALPA